MAYTDVCGKKLRAKMGAVLNESATAHSPALLSADRSFAKRQLEKMGWAEGTGLGKRRDGRKEHVKIKQREDEMGLGREAVRAQEVGNAWWKDSVGGTLARLQQQQQQKKEKKKKKEERTDRKRKKDGKKSTPKQSGERCATTKGLSASATPATTAVKTFTDEELFEATGGARFGMRAQRRAEGKWKRTEAGTALARLEEDARASMEWDGRGSARAVTKEVSHCKTKKRAREDAGGAVDKTVSPSVSEEDRREESSEDGSRSERKRRKREKQEQCVVSEKDEKESKKKKRKKKEKKLKRNK